ncbi:MAG: hypothetical protein M0035_05520 [Actinomycetota bacterium]|nr:hypothetical protein [Actinomycetota bacterium]
MSTPDGPPLDLGQLGEVVGRHGADYLIVGASRPPATARSVWPTMPRASCAATN